MFRLLTATVFALGLAACAENASDTAVTQVMNTVERPPAYSLDLPLALPANTSSKIAEEDLHQRISILSNDAFEGRGPGTPIGEKTADWLAAEFDRLGLKPAGLDRTFFQPVEMVTQSIDELASSIQFRNAKTQSVVPVEFGDAAVFWTKRQNALDIQFDDLPLAFVGYGVVAPEYGWDDYAGIDVTGKAVVILVNDPGFGGRSELFNGKAMTYYGRWMYKFEEAKRQGAAGAIIIHEDVPASYGWDVVKNSWSLPQAHLLQMGSDEAELAFESWITADKANALFRQSGTSLRAAKRAALRDDFAPFDMGHMRVSGRILQSVSPSVSRNVIAKIRGTQRPSEYILYTAHWDHMGRKSEEKQGLPGQDFYRDEIFNGAVDNATGTAAMLEIAEKMAASPPKRSALFVAFTLEESGLLGSAHFAQNPTVPLRSIVAGMNIDGMIPSGRSRDMVVIGYGASELETRLENLLAARDRVIVPDPNPEAGLFYRSDHVSLAKVGVPMLYSDSGIDLLDGGTLAGKSAEANYVTHRYHKPMDEYARSWNMEGIAENTGVLFDLGYELAQSSDWPNWYEGNEFRAIRDQSRNIAGGQQ